MLYEKQDFTESHMFKINIFSGYLKFVKNLEKANIIVDSAGRIGTNEMTRLGMKEKEMKEIALLISQIYNQQNTQEVKKKAKLLRSGFQEVKYC